MTLNTYRFALWRSSLVPHLCAYAYNGTNCCTMEFISHKRTAMYTTCADAKRIYSRINLLNSSMRNYSKNQPRELCAGMRARKQRAVKFCFILYFWCGIAQIFVTNFRLLLATLVLFLFIIIVLAFLFNLLNQYMYDLKLECVFFNSFDFIFQKLHFKIFFSANLLLCFIYSQVLKTLKLYELNSLT